MTGNIIPGLVISGTINIAGGSAPVLETATVKSTNVEQTITPEEGVDGFSSVTVEALELQAKTATLSNQQQVIEPDSGKDGLSSVTVPAVSLQNKSVTPTGSEQTITADNGYDGLGTVTVGASGGDIDFVMNPDSYGVAENSFAHQEHLKSFTCNNHNSSNSTFRVDTNAFASCSALTTVRIERCNTFNGMTFPNCNNITDYYFGGSFNGTVPNYNMMTPADFSGAPNYKIHVPASLESAWKSDLGWGEYADHIVGDYTE